MNPALNRKTVNIAEPQGSVPELQPLHQYLDLLKTSLDRYTYLKKSGAPDSILYTEQGLIERQFQFLFKVCKKLEK